jgi:hypothetical protein
MSDKALADAINNLAEAIHKLAAYDRIGHEICMGLRHGLFGNGDESNNIGGIADRIEIPLKQIADAVENLDDSGIVTYDGG